MQPAEKVLSVLSRFEAVEWRYDGLNGKIIPWTKERGNDHHDPSVLAFVVSPDEKLFAKCPGQSAYNAGGFSKWLREQASLYEKKHPRTRVPFVRANVTAGSGEVRCAALDEARKARKPIILYFGREERAELPRKVKGEVKASRAFERKQMNSKPAEEAAKGWVLLRFDLSDPTHATFAKSLGVEKTPSTLMLIPGEETPQDLTPKLRSGSLAYWLKKHR